MVKLYFLLIKMISNLAPPSIINIPCRYRKIYSRRQKSAVVIGYFCYSRRLLRRQLQIAASNFKGCINPRRGCYGLPASTASMPLPRTLKNSPSTCYIYHTIATSFQGLQNFEKWLPLEQATLTTWLPKAIFHKLNLALSHVEVPTGKFLCLLSRHA